MSAPSHPDTPKSTLPQYLHLHSLFSTQFLKQKRKREALDARYSSASTQPANASSKSLSSNSSSGHEISSLNLYKDVTNSLMENEELHHSLLQHVGCCSDETRVHLQNHDAMNNHFSPEEEVPALPGYRVKMGPPKVKNLLSIMELPSFTGKKSAGGRFSAAEESSPSLKLLSRRQTQESSVIPNKERFVELIHDFSQINMSDKDRNDLEQIVSRVQQTSGAPAGTTHSLMSQQQQQHHTASSSLQSALPRHRAQKKIPTPPEPTQEKAIKKKKKRRGGFKIPRMTSTSQDDEPQPRSDFVSAASLPSNFNKSNGNNNNTQNSNKRKRPYNSSSRSFDPASSLKKNNILNNRRDIPSSDDEPVSAPPRKRTKKFVNPVEKKKRDEKKKKEEESKKNRPGAELGLFDADGELPKELQGLEEVLVERIALEVLESKTTITWNDIGGLEYAKQAVEEAVLWPLQQPELFESELLQGTRGLMLFGPPGTGKTLIAKAIASQGAASFFSISASSLMSKWLGEGEQLVKTLFKVAAFLSPSIIFLDEIDAILAKRGQGDDAGGARRLKTEFLIQLDGAGSNTDGVVIICATNLPWEIDDAVLRRMRQKIYVPLPDADARLQIVKSHARKGGRIQFNLNDEEFDELAKLTEGYSGSDLKKLSQQAMMIVIREIKRNAMQGGTKTERGVCLRDYVSALKEIRPSVDTALLNQFVEWDKKFGSTAE